MNIAFLALVVALGLFVLAVVMPIATFLRIRRVAENIRRIDGRLDELESAVRRVRATTRELGVGEGETVAVTAVGRPPVARPAPAPDNPVVPAPLVEPGSAAAPVPAAGTAPALHPASAPASGPSSRPSAAPPTPAPLSIPAFAAKEAPSSAIETLESRIGGRWLLYIGTAALVLGIGFFVKYAFDNNWINETGRVLIGAAIGLVMVVGGDRIARRGYPLYGQILAGGGFAVLYISVYAALSFYGLVGRPAAFGLMVAITAGAALAAELHRSQGLALFALVGGFLTPFLVGGGENAQVVLLSYDTLLVVGTMLMAARHGWPLLNVVSYVFVIFTFMGWADRFYTPAQYVPTQVFLVIFGALFTYVGIRARRTRNDLTDVVGILLLTAPLVFHAASLANLQTHWMPLFVYLTLVALAGVAASMKLDRAWLRLAVFAVTAPVLWQWIGEHGGPGWLLAPATVAAAIYAMNLVAVGERLSRHPEPWLKADLLLFHANALGLFAGLYGLFEPVATAWMPGLALALAIWHGVLSWVWRDTSEEAGLNSLAVAFAMLGFAIGLQFDRWWAVVGWAIEAAAIIWVGLRSRREWMRIGGAALLAWTIVRLFMLGYFEAPAGFMPVFNPRVGVTLVVVGVCYLLALIHQRNSDHLDDRAQPEIAALYVVGNLLTIVLVTTEIIFYWHVREYADAAADLARMASVSVAWATYGTALIVVGIVRRYAPVRYLAIALLALTIVKTFVFDLSTLGGIYRIIGFVGLGLFLLLGAWLYQRYRDVILGRQ